MGLLEIYNNFLLREYEDTKGVKSLGNRLGLAYTTDGDDEEHEIQVDFNMTDCQVEYYYDWQLVGVDKYANLDEFAEVLEIADFDVFYHEAMCFI